MLCCASCVLLSSHTSLWMNETAHFMNTRKIMRDAGPCGFALPSPNRPPFPVLGCLPAISSASLLPPNVLALIVRYLAQVWLVLRSSVPNSPRVGAQRNLDPSHRTSHLVACPLPRLNFLPAMRGVHKAYRLARRSRCSIFSGTVPVLCVCARATLPCSVLQACNVFRLYNGKAAETELKALADRGHNLQVRHELHIYVGPTLAPRTGPPCS